MNPEQWGSIRLRFSSVFLFVLAVVMILGSFSAWRLSDYRTYSDDLRDRFFRSTQYLGDLNNYTSDFRAAEGAELLSRTPVEVASTARDMKTLDNQITLAQRHYEHVVHDRGETDVYERFWVQWSAYRNVVNRVVGLVFEGRRKDAVALYMTTSRTSYDAASDTLGKLTDLNVANAAAASGRADAAFREARFLTVAAMVFAALMVAGGLIYMRRSIADPLVELSRAMNGLARNEMDIQIQGAERADEIGGMARAVEIFRLNAIDLAVSQRALANQASMLTDKLAAEQRLTQLQRNFLSMASHEFRTPLAIIDGHAQRMINAKALFSPDDLADRAGKIRRAVLRITSVIDHLIDGARLVDSGADALFHPTEVNLTSLLREVCRLHRELVPAAHIWEAFGDAPMLMVGDQKLLMHLFSNLISNGIKYSPAEIRLKVSASITGDSAIVTVEDHGIGIPEADQDHLFERYFRGTNVSGTVGTGVGLYLVKAVVDLHRGEVTVESRAEKGSIFTIRLPINALRSGDAMQAAGSIEAARI